ncbi:unnamed protein product [Peniophora sp. CBMAI 1063]|nr:unnamed protein product [Peniophora sp. CBMAI 1063]
MDFRQGASDSDNPQPAGQSATRPIVDPGPEPGLRDVLGSLWLQALRNYKAKTGVDPLEDRLLKDLAGRNDVKGILEVFDRRMRDFKEFRASDTKWGKLRDKYLIPAVHTVLTLTDALAEVASFFPVVPGGKAIFVAFGALLAATEGVSNRYDALLELFEEVPFFLEGVDVRASEPQNWGTPTRSVAIAILVQLLDIFSLAIQTTSGPWRRLVQYRKSLVGSTDMQKALAHMKGLTVLETRAMASETRVIVANVQREIQDLLSANDAYAILLKDVVGKLEDANHQVADEYGQIRAGRIREQQELEQIRRSQAEAAEEATLARLQRLDVADLTSQARSGCLEGTRLTVLSDLDAWSREPDAPRVYWVNGMAGTGKSAIARTFGRRLYDAKMLGGSFFCSRESNVEQQNAKRIIPTLAAALAGRYMKYRSALVKSLMASAAEPSPGFWGVAEQIQRLLVEPFACFVDDEYPCFVLVVDALDETESGTAQELVQLLVDNSKRLPLKFFLTSRPEIHLRRHLDSLDASLRLHDIAKETVTSDINLYVSCRMHDIRGRFESVKIDLPTGWPSSSDVRMLADLSDRLFIHAFTTTEYIGGGDPLPKIQPPEGSGSNL